jgi:putative exporter of polyketide antibiotics
MLGRHGIVFYGSLGKFTWRMLATVLASQGIVVFLGSLVARGIASAEGDTRGTTWLWLGVGLSVLCFAAAGLMRRPWGVTLGWLLQVSTFVSALVVPAMLAVGVLFLLLWVGSLVLCHRAEEQLARREREAAAG